MGKPSLIQEVLLKFDDLRGVGISKREMREVQAAYTGKDYKDCRSPLIHSILTEDTYKRHCLDFARWAKENHQVRHLKDLTPALAAEYLALKMKNGDKPSSLRTYASALAKMMGCSYRDFPIKLPPVEYKAFTRGRSASVTSEAWARRHPDVVKFVQATGLRKKGVWGITAGDIHECKGWFSIHVPGPYAKGGRPRIVVPLRAQWAQDIVRQFRDRALAHGGPGTKIMFDLKRPRKWNGHSERARYAWLKYCEIAKPEVRGRYDLWVRRETGEVLDKRALRIVTRNLGHNRLDVVIRDYWYRRE